MKYLAIYMLTTPTRREYIACTIEALDENEWVPDEFARQVLDHFNNVSDDDGLATVIDLISESALFEPYTINILAIDNGIPACDKMILFNIDQIEVEV